MKRISRSIYFALTVVLLFFVHPSIQKTHYAVENDTLVVESVSPCHLYGDPDLYGIGIRLSFYLTWFGFFAAVALGKEEEISGIRRGFNIVALAVLINTYISAANGSFAVLEMTIVSYLVVVLSVYFSIPLRRPKIKSLEDFNIFESEFFLEDPLGIATTMLIDAGFFASQPWIYFKIIRQGSKSICDPKIWILKSFSLYSSHWIGFMKFSAMFGTIFAPSFIIVALTAAGRDLFKLKGASGPPPPERESILSIEPRTIKESLKFAWEVTKEFFKRIREVSRGAKLLIFVFPGQLLVILSIERTIQANNIDLNSAPLISTSQLIPFLVGIFSTVTVGWISLRPHISDAWAKVRDDVNERKWQRAFEKHQEQEREKFRRAREAGDLLFEFAQEWEPERRRGQGVMTNDQERDAGSATMTAGAG